MATKLVVLMNYSCLVHSHWVVSPCVTWAFFAFEHFLVALEPVTVSVSAAVAVSFSAPAQEFVNKFVSQVVSNL